MYRKHILAFAMCMIAFLAVSAAAYSPPKIDPNLVSAAEPVASYLGDPVGPIDIDYTLVRFMPASDDKGMALWKESFGSLSAKGGYTLTKAQTITRLYLTDDVASGAKPCDCSMEGAKYKYYNPCPDPGDNLGAGCCKDECPGGPGPKASNLAYLRGDADMTAWSTWQRDAWLITDFAFYHAQDRGHPAVVIRS